MYFESARCDNLALSESTALGPLTSDISGTSSPSDKHAICSAASLFVIHIYSHAVKIFNLFMFSQLNKTSKRNIRTDDIYYIFRNGISS